MNGICEHCGFPSRNLVIVGSVALCEDCELEIDDDLDVPEVVQAEQLAQSEVNPDEWEQWAISHNADPIVREFLRP